MDINVKLLQRFINLLIKKLLVVLLKMKICQTKNQDKNYINQLLEDLKKKVHSSFIYNIWDADLADMQLISKFRKGIRFLLRVTDIQSKYVQVIPSKDEKGITITNVFQKKLGESNHKPNKTWVD